MLSALLGLVVLVSCAASRGRIVYDPVTLPGAPITPAFAQYTGYVEVNKTAGANLFFWLVESQRDATSDPVVLWLTGGPGCSAELALLFENGPYNVAVGGQTLVPNPYSWNRRATVLYVDSPVGTGFSYLTNPDGYVTNEKQMADELYTVITTVLSTFGYLKKLPFYVFGESYAGHYVPSISERILEGNRKRDGSPVNMQGLAIGNGMTFPLKQYSKYADFSLAHALISQQTKDQLDQIYSQCEQQLKTNNPNASDTCNSILSTVQQLGGNFNVYNVDESCLGDLCYSGMTDVNTYLNRADVLAALHVNPNVTKWQSCDATVYQKIATPDWFKQEEYVIPFLLDSYKVLIYNGVNDWICNHAGNYKWVTEMAWNGQAAFNTAPRLPWTSADYQLVKGYQQQAGNLQFVWVVNAGHMVPHDQPERALELFESFIFSAPLTVQNITSVRK